MVDLQRGSAVRAEEPLRNLAEDQPGLTAAQIFRCSDQNGELLTTQDEV